MVIFIVLLLVIAAYTGIPSISTIAFIISFLSLLSVLTEGDFYKDIIFILLLSASAGITFVGVRRKG
jgi:hypothetical protein